MGLVLLTNPNGEKFIEHCNGCGTILAEGRMKIANGNEDVNFDHEGEGYRCPACGTLRKGIPKLFNTAEHAKVWISAHVFL